MADDEEIVDSSVEDLSHPQIDEIFIKDDDDGGGSVSEEMRQSIGMNDSTNPSPTLFSRQRHQRPFSRPSLTDGSSSRTSKASSTSRLSGSSIGQALGKLRSRRRSASSSNVTTAKHIGAGSSLARSRRLAPPNVFFKSSHSSTVSSGANDAARRRYKVDEKVLVMNSQQSEWRGLVNVHGYPAGEGFGPEEQRGPYVYILATVKKVHFDEDAQYYTVIRADNNAEQRADSELMHRIPTKAGEEAALLAATYDFSQTDATDPNHHHIRHLGGVIHNDTDSAEGSWDCIIRIILLPILCPFLLFTLYVWRPLRRLFKRSRATLKSQLSLFLNGNSFTCSSRITFVNLLVVCSTYFFFIDQVRLAFFPPDSDETIAIISFVVWLVLVIELMLEWFIRPRGYQALLHSENAFAPTTALYINSFHLSMETISLALFIPEFLCVLSSRHSCSDRITMGLLDASIVAVEGPTRWDVLYGRAVIALIRLRVFGLIRHWKKMLLNKAYDHHHQPNKHSMVHPETAWESVKTISNSTKMTQDNISTRTTADVHPRQRQPPVKTQEQQDSDLTRASHIETALMVLNSHRAFIFLGCVVAVFPIITSLGKNGANPVASTMTEQLQANNILLNKDSAEYCQFLFHTTTIWSKAVNTGHSRSHYGDHRFTLWAQLLPARCPMQQGGEFDGVITASVCHYLLPVADKQDITSADNLRRVCEVWSDEDGSSTPEHIADKANLRVGAITMTEESTVAPLYFTANNTWVNTTYSVKVMFNRSNNIRPSAVNCFVLQIILLGGVLISLFVLTNDAKRLVIRPLRRMLKIVAIYSKNPLSSVKEEESGLNGDNGKDEEKELENDGNGDEDQLGEFETKQLINAVSKITDLLTRCWGVAGAGIISSNLARQQNGLSAMFNPCVPGKSVYALFGFIAIKGFDHQLRALGSEIMILINDVAEVLHNEVFRWGFNDSGQCNKNLGSAFLMVYRIGDTKEVKHKLKTATSFIFSSSDSSQKHAAVSPRARYRKSRKTKSDRAPATKANAEMFLSLVSLPGIEQFTDRALIGMLKAFAGIYRDKKLMEWKKDFRLGAGVDAFSLEMQFGIDAGWAVEGAVGSEYKIDATYLSPHVNMASRMMSASKQYGVTILLSQAVEELLSDAARSKLRHLDTVTVKGSSMKQRIYTYDARHQGVDFFLFSRSEQQADRDSEVYSTDIWNTDQDLTAMRQHVTDEFVDAFEQGRMAYLNGDWPTAIETLTKANEIMVEHILDSGYIHIESLQDSYGSMRAQIADEEEEELLRESLGDGPSLALIAFMKKEGGIAPQNWQGYRPLTSK